MNDDHQRQRWDVLMSGNLGCLRHKALRGLTPDGHPSIACNIVTRTIESCFVSGATTAEDILMGIIERLMIVLDAYGDAMYQDAMSRISPALFDLETAQRKDRT